MTSKVVSFQVPLGSEYVCIRDSPINRWGLMFSCIMCPKRKTLRRQLSSRAIFSLWLKRVSYGELLKATNGFSDENLIGGGSYGFVYKGFLGEINMTVAVKVLKLQIEGASKSFLKECNALRYLRHRNLLKIITSCSSVDYRGNDFKALVFYFMPNGSLEDWLHPRGDERQTSSRFLNFTHRLNIAIDVANALEYLHHYCRPYFVHCDIKPSNVLLDDNMTAHVADFGIAKMFVSSFSHDSAQSLVSSVVIKGSIGYVAPEYFAGHEVSMRGDVYSYGILLLEMFTSKKPTDDMFVNGLSLYDYAEMALPDQIMDIIDPMVLRQENSVQNTVDHMRTGGSLHQCLVSMIRTTVACCDRSSVKRMTMREVVVELQCIRKRYQGARVNVA